MSSPRIVQSERDVPLRQRLMQFAGPASIEITPDDEVYIPDLRGLLPPNTTVYVAHTPKLKLQDVLRTADRVQEAGFNASAHLVARGLRSEQQLRSALHKLQDAGCDRALLIAGDHATPAGPYASTLDVLSTGLTMEYGITTLAVAGHPEGHPAVGGDALWDALARKQEFAHRTGTKVLILTQFGFNPEAMLAWGQSVRDRGIILPIHAGLAGPTPLSKLIRYAVRCGIGASLRTLQQKGSGFAQLASLAQINTTPDEVLIGLLEGREARGTSLVAQPHFFSFGGCVETARWLKAVREGNFTLHEDETGFTVG